ncbi:ERAP1-like C-terminal domain [Rhizoctonia solani]|uniref:ERAP1-like C-terminal domain n=1 Tax=Rhizoctonia solani TaxID=456999 RepID=A0A8H7HDK5_9AGAM|nr:ERAP1-like C-terminal domain [Rhizoctonia solani]
MIRSGLSVARSTRSAGAIHTNGVGRRWIGTTTRTSRTQGFGTRNSGAFITGAALAAATATIYAFNAAQVAHNEDPNSIAASISGSKNTAPLKLEDDGKLHTYVWGSNKYNILSPGSGKDTIRTPEDVISWTGLALRDLAFHEKHAACVDAAGDVYQWGDAYYGEGNSSGGPQRTLSGKNVSQIALSAARVFALSEKTGKIYVLSQDSEKQTRNDTTEGSWWNLGGWLGGNFLVDYLELKVDSKLNRGEKFTSISAGRDHLIALTSQGRTFSLPISISANTYGQLGFRKFTLPDSTAENPSIAPRIPIELTPRILEDPHALATPFVRTGQTGSSTYVDPGIGFCDMLFEIPSLRGLKIAQASAGDRCSYVRTEDGRVLTWGANSFGQLGLGATVGKEAVTIPTEVILSRNYPAGSNVKCTGLATGGDIAYFVVDVIAPDNTASVDVLACGMGQWGGLGNGQFLQLQGAPVKVKSVSGITEYNEATRSVQPLRTRSISVSPAPQTSHALLTLDTGTLGEAPSAHRAHPVGHDVLVLGYNADGQLGNGKRANLCVPSHVSALGGVVGRMMLKNREKVALIDMQGRSCGKGSVEETAVAGWNCNSKSTRPRRKAQDRFQLHRRPCFTSSHNIAMSAPAQQDTPKPREEYRLPTNARPTHYDLTIQTDLDALTFKGFVIIDLDIVEETSIITFNSSNLILHENGLNVTSEALKTEQTQSVKLTGVDEKSERASVQLTTPLPKGSKAKLRIGYEGKLTGSMMGYYYSSAHHEGKPRNYTLTQFEPTAARRAFPCWDEPALKATYSVTMISREDTVSLSNMPATNEKPFVESEVSESEKGGVGKLVKMKMKTKVEGTTVNQKGWKITTFEKSPPMSSYLVAFANGHFEHLESSYTSPISGKTRPLRIYATKDIIHQAQFALDVKAKVLPIYEKVFDVEYPLPKLDTLVANDFDAGAMENWGLITGRTSVFLFDEKKSDLAAKKRVATVQSHECAHMWFGDIVTMNWWNSLWLNEGFATIAGEVIIIDKVFPEWRVHSEFITHHLERALELDAQRSSHPIEVDCPDANQINQIFDALSYSKAASMLRMLARYVGEDTFLKGVSIYLKKRLYGNSDPKDLWDGITEAAGVDVGKVMKNWVFEIGFPFLTVTETADGIHVRQDRFLSTGDATDAENQTIWHIPLSLLTVGADGKATVDHSIVLSERETDIKLDTSRPWKLNAGTVGVFRSAYTPERLAKLGEEASRSGSVFSLEDRVGLVSDAMVLARAGYGKTSGGLNLISRLHDESEHLVWEGIASHLNTIEKVWWEQPAEQLEALKAFRRYLFTPLVKKLGYDFDDNDAPDVRQLRTLAITQSATAQDKTVIKELRSRFAHFHSTGDDSKIPADLQRIIYRTAVHYGGEEEYEAVKKIAENPPTPSSKIAAMLAMTYAQDNSLVEKTLQYMDTSVKDQDIMYYFAGLSGNRASRRRIAKYFKENYEKIYKRFEGNFSLNYLVKYSFDSFSTEKDAKDVEEFFKDKDTSKYNLALAQTLDSIRASTKWLDRSRDDVAEWLADWEKKMKA